MSDMELSVTGEEGDLSEDYSESEQLYTDREQHSISIQTTNYIRQGENHAEKVTTNGRRESDHRRMVDITRDKPVKVTVRVVVPVRDHPKFNFVGKLLGPKGNSLKRLQEDTMTKMAILGRGSMRDKHKNNGENVWMNLLVCGDSKGDMWRVGLTMRCFCIAPKIIQEEELRLSGDPKFSHLHEDLHVEITAFAPPAEAHARIAYALADVRRFLVPDYNDDIRQEQMWEMQILKERPENSPIINDGLGLHVLGTTIPVVPTSTGTTSPTNSNGSQSPHTPPPGIIDTNTGTQIMLPAQHPALRGVTTVQGVKTCIPMVAPSIGPVAGRKRPLIHTTKHALSPTKRTVMSILARARAAQGKEIPGYHVNGNGTANLVGIRQDGAVISPNLV